MVQSPNVLTEQLWDGASYIKKQKQHPPKKNPKNKTKKQEFLQVIRHKGPEMKFWTSCLFYGWAMVDRGPDPRIAILQFCCGYITTKANEKPRLWDADHPQLRFSEKKTCILVWSTCTNRLLVWPLGKKWNDIFFRRRILIDGMLKAVDLWLRIVYGKQANDQWFLRAGSSVNVI